MTETHTTTKNAVNTITESLPSATTSAPQTTSSSTSSKAPNHRSSSTAMFAAGCFMAVFSSAVFIFLIARLQWKRISPILAAVKMQWKRVFRALEGCHRWLVETAVSVMARMKKSTNQSTKRITRWFDSDFRDKSLPPIPSTTSERQPLSSEPLNLLSPSPMSSFVPIRALEPSPWPQPLEIRQYPFHYRPNLRREWRNFRPTGEQQQPAELPVVELPASPVPLQLLQARGLGVHQGADTMGNGYNSLDEPQIQQAQLQRLHRIQNMVHVVRPPALQQYRPYRKPLQRVAS
ncbi:hypothetical protein CMQ_752 [Grosmannia clavigera kw1407]|uniref:Uncharacterized protein n=1 Tax=Grosmannia clavigera (strain kw1407 / UAMH 11150) TaxID=655863 RepID=F0XD12_GROCL|nr:uncharacterized protein CMQ_752 [Grosmannia clavigera kw1407]EFX03824.1 hypothetical protein CMQ_752 [Grosmannia clavigera kw1407]